MQEATETSDFVLEEGPSVGPGGYRSELFRKWRYPPFCKSSCLEEIQHGATIRPSDIVIATYPKCGTTWMQQIVLTLLAQGEVDKVRDPMKLSPWPENMLSLGKLGGIEDWNSWQPAPESQASLPGRRVIKTHAPYQLAPWRDIEETDEGTRKIPKKIPNNGAKIIVVTRNPKDAAVSLFNHTIDLRGLFGYSGDWPTFLNELFLPGLVESSCYWEWTKTWFDAFNASDNEGRDKIFWISYEEMKKDLNGSILKIAEFLNIQTNPEILLATASACSFDTMKQVFADEDAKKLARGETTKPNHIRQGQVGGWTSWFTQDQNEVFDKHHLQKCHDLSLPLDIFTSM